MAPGLGEILGVRLPLMEAAHKSFQRGTAADSSGPLLDVVERLIGSRYVAMPLVIGLMPFALATVLSARLLRHSRGAVKPSG